MYWSGELFMRSREWYFDVYLAREINTKITLEGAHKEVLTRVHDLIYFLFDITNPWITIKKDNLHTSCPVPPSLGFRSADDITIDNRLLMTSQWADNCDASTWKEITTRLIWILSMPIFTVGHERIMEALQHQLFVPHISIFFRLRPRDVFDGHHSIIWWRRLKFWWP